MNDKVKNIQTYISLSVFLISGTAVFSPIYKSENPAVSLFFALVFGTVFTLISLRCFSTVKKDRPKKTFLFPALSVSASLFSVFISLLLLTQVIREAAYIAGRGVNLPYYILLGIAILAVSYYLCYNSEKGIFRFCIPCAIIFAALLFIIPTSFFSTKSAVVNHNLFSITDKMFSSAVIGITSALMISADISAYLFCFKSYITDSYGRLPKKTVGASFLTAFIFLLIQYSATLLIFGKNLTLSLKFPFYALIKLCSPCDVTELLTCAKIISFIIKSSVYSYCCAVSLKKAFCPKKENALVGFMLGTYLVIPIIFIILVSMFGENQYGALQHLIYPCVFILSLHFLFLYLLKSKKTRK